MRVLITGASGFVGGHAIRDLRQAGHSVIAMVAPGQPTLIDGSDVTEAMDILDADGIRSYIERHRPDACLHLAGMAFVPHAWKEPQKAFAVNVNGTINVLEGFREYRPDARILVITSAQVYGHQNRGQPIREDDALLPDNLYALTKSAADQATLLYAHHHGMTTMTARPCNHIGPGQSESFVVSAFTRQLMAIQRGDQPNQMRVGNLASLREFTDVRDMARAYRLLLEKGHTGHAYNVASGKLITIQSLFDHLCSITGVNPTTVIDPALFRPTDAQPILDITRIHTHTGWHPEIPLATTLHDVVADFARR